MAAYLPHLFVLCREWPCDGPLLCPWSPMKALSVIISFCMGKGQETQFVNGRVVENNLTCSYNANMKNNFEIIQKGAHTCPTTKSVYHIHISTEHV
jgi:hypothetical protein